VGTDLYVLGPLWRETAQATHAADDKKLAITALADINAEVVSDAIFGGPHVSLDWKLSVDCLCAEPMSLVQIKGHYHVAFRWLLPCVAFRW
jgi:hypothetical protein